jgi:hypothetical protein
MLLSYQIPEWRPYQTAALDLMEVERDIATRQHSKNSIDRKILPRLIEKRARLQLAVGPLKEAFEAAERRALERTLAPPVVTDAPARQPMAPQHGVDDLDIPDFLRRQSAC